MGSNLYLLKEREGRDPAQTRKSLLACEGFTSRKAPCSKLKQERRVFVKCECRRNREEKKMSDNILWLRMKSLLRLRCVSKTWCFLISSPTFITRYLNKTTTKKNGLLLCKYRLNVKTKTRVTFYTQTSISRLLGRGSSLAPLQEPKN